MYFFFPNVRLGLPQDKIVAAHGSFSGAAATCIDCDQEVDLDTVKEAILGDKSESVLFVFSLFLMITFD